jgi:hypothetical protein
MNKSWRITGWVALSVLVLALLAWVGLPVIIRYQVNRGMADMKDGYVGHVEDVSIAWLDGRMSVHRLRIDRPGREVGAPFMLVKEIQMEVLWREASKPLLGMRFIEPVLNFIDAPGDANDQKGPGFTLAELRKKLPLDLGAMSIADLELHFRNFQAKPAVDTYIQNVNASAAPLDRCIQDPPVGCDAKAQLEGTLMRGGQLRAHADFAYDDAFTLGARASLRSLALKDLNPLLLKYADVDVQEGTLGADARIRVDGSNYRVVLDPSLKDAKVIGGEKHQTKAGRELGVALGARFVERMGDELSVILKGGSGKKMDWDITRRGERGEQGRNARDANQPAHAALVDR